MHYEAELQLLQKHSQTRLVNLSAEVVDIKGVKVLSKFLPEADVDTLRTTMDQLKNKLGSAVIVLAASENEKVVLVAGVTKNLVTSLKAGDLMREISAIVGGKGGGRPDMAQGGGTKIDAIPDALAFVPKWVENHT